MRAIWKGSINFGLVNIPISMFTASQEKEISFVLLHKKDHSRIHYARVCESEGKEVPWSEIEKGYEIEEGKYIVLDNKDFEKANLKKTQTIEIVCFIDEKDVDTVYYVKPYYLEPSKEAHKAYSILRDALKKTKKVGLARYVLHNKEHLALIKIHDNMLIMNQLRYQNELLAKKDLQIPETTSTPQEINAAAKLINQLTQPFIPKKYTDTYVEEIKRIIKQKSEGRRIQTKTSKAPKPSKIHDIMALLQASLETPKNKKKSSKKTKKSA